VEPIIEPAIKSAHAVDARSIVDFDTPQSQDAPRSRESFLLVPPEAAPSTPAVQPSPEPEPETEPEPEPEPDFSTPEIKIQMAGDILLHTGPVRAAQTPDGYDFAPYFSMIAPYLDGDLNLCNMETPVDVFGANRELSSFPKFNVPYEILPALRGAGFHCLITANNHAYDKGWDGLTATKRNIEEAGLDVDGTFETQEQFDSPKILDVNGLKIGIISYTDSANGLDTLIPPDKRPFSMRRFSSYSLLDVPAMTADIERLRAFGMHLVIVSLHWGVEYADQPRSTQRDIARALCDAGADIVMGSHSHCVQPVEWHESADGRSSLILYSLGNFFADQTGLKIPKTQYGMVVSVRVRLDRAGALTWEGVEILPTMTYRYADRTTRNGVNYRLLPLDMFATDVERPEVFSSNSEWAKAQKAFAHVDKITGDAVAVMGR